MASLREGRHLGSGFVPGQRVEWTEYAMRDGIVSRKDARENPYGTVVKEHLLDCTAIKVRRDGHKISRTYSACYWKKATND